MAAMMHRQQALCLGGRTRTGTEAAPCSVWLLGVKIAVSMRQPWWSSRAMVLAIRTRFARSGCNAPPSSAHAALSAPPRAAPRTRSWRRATRLLTALITGTH